MLTYSEALVKAKDVISQLANLPEGTDDAFQVSASRIIATAMLNVETEMLKNLRHTAEAMRNDDY